MVAFQGDMVTLWGDMVTKGGTGWQWEATGQRCGVTG